jgi:hypothetical protein
MGGKRVGSGFMLIFSGRHGVCGGGLGGVYVSHQSGRGMGSSGNTIQVISV